jgi:hypothetical protein
VLQPEIGSLDFAGAARLVGPSVDMGAFEFQPAPVVLTAAADELSLTGALLHGSVDTGGALITGCRFEYGTTSAYGSLAACAPGTPSGEGVSAVSAALSGLQPGTIYHFTLVASGAGGEGRGQDTTFTTPTPIPPSQPGSQPPPARVAPTLSLASTVLSLKPGGAVGVLRATCRAPAGRRCTVTGNVLASSALLGTKGRARTLRIGSAHASIAAGTTSSVTVRLSPAAVRALRRRHSFSARLTATVGDGEASSTLAGSLRVKLISSRR